MTYQETAKVPTKRCIQALDKLVLKLEAWQQKYSYCAPVDELDELVDRIDALVVSMAEAREDTTVGMRHSGPDSKRKGLIRMANARFGGLPDCVFFAAAKDMFGLEPEDFE